MSPWPSPKMEKRQRVLDAEEAGLLLRWMHEQQLKRMAGVA